MIRTLLVAALLCVVYSSANACDVMRPCYGNGRPLFDSGLAQGSLPNHRAVRHRAERHAHRRIPTGLARVMAEGAGKAIGRPSRYIAGRLICAINVNSALAERGIKGTGSALAKSFLHWGVASAPVPGAVAVSSRRGGGHVAIVSRVTKGQIYVWNPSPRGRGWQEQPYRHRAIAFRVAGRQSVF